VSHFKARMAAGGIAVAVVAASTLPAQARTVQTAAAPIVTSVSPGSGISSGSTRVLVRGRGFAAGATVTFGNVAGADVRIVAGTSLTVTAPRHVVGGVDVRVRVGAHRSPVSPGDRYTYLEPPALRWAQPVDPARLVGDDFSAGDPFSVSCPTTSFCASIDGYGNVLTERSGHWSAPLLPTGRITISGGSVSCTITQFCVAVGAGYSTAVTSAVVTYHSGVWSAASSIVGVGPLNAVSCASSTFCVAVDSGGRVAYWRGRGWSVAKIGAVGLNGVSCPSSSFCSAVDQHGRAYTYDGRSWARPVTIDSKIALNAVSCPTSTFCVAVDDAGRVLTFTGMTWSRGKKLTRRALEAVSCKSRIFCAAVGRDSVVKTFDGADWRSVYGAWSTVDLQFGGALMTSVSCPTDTFCGWAYESNRT
jgi:hypothetical protein